MSFNKSFKNKKHFDKVFCIIFCRDAKPYSDYDVYINSDLECHRAKVHKKYPAILAQMRHDCKIGFPGGKIDNLNLSLIENLKKELFEEINFKDIDISKLELLSTFFTEKSKTTVFSYEVSFEEMKDIVINSKNAPHSFVENMGSFIFKLDSSTINNINKHHFSGNGLDELNLLINKKELL